MATRALIALKHKYENNYTVSGCLSEGYPNHCGRYLLDYYFRKDRLKDLLKLGLIECLEARFDSIKKRNDFNNKLKHIANFPVNIDYKQLLDIAKEHNIDYIYIHDKYWKVFD